MGGLVFLAGGALALWPGEQRWTVWNVIGIVLALGMLGGAAWAMWGTPHGATVHTAGRPLLRQLSPVSQELDALLGRWVEP
jgi:hypothetical protein